MAAVVALPSCENSSLYDYVRSLPIFNLTTFGKEDRPGTSTRPINTTAEGGPRPKLQTNRIGTILVCLFILLITLSVSGAIIYVVLRSKERTKASQSQEEETEKLEIDREDVGIGEEIGQGCFGAVFKGTFKNPAQVKINDRVILIREVRVSLTLGSNHV